MSTNEVENLLKTKNIQFIPKGKDVLITCLNPDHEDANPSLRIDREGGAFHCLGCGYKGNIFSMFNRTRNVLNAKVRKVQKAVLELRKASWSGLEFPSDAFFMSSGFRGISKEIVEKFQGFKTNQHNMADRVVFPIYDTENRMVGLQGRYEFSDANPRYMAYPADTPLPWYPNVHRISRRSDLILVEGLRDALVMHSYGIDNVTCIFGTKSVSMENIEEHLIPFILGGVSSIKLLMDGDPAGRAAAKHLETCITRKTDLEVEIIELADNQDPASMTEKELRTLTKVYKQENQ